MVQGGVMEMGSYMGIINRGVIAFCVAFQAKKIICGGHFTQTATRTDFAGFVGVYRESFFIPLV